MDHRLHDPGGPRQPHVGTFGTSMPLDQIAPAGRFAGSIDENVILISREGRLIYHPDYTLQHSSHTGTYLDITTSDTPELAALWQLVSRHGKTGFSGQGRCAGRLRLLAFDPGRWMVCSGRQAAADDPGRGLAADPADRRDGGDRADRLPADRDAGAAPPGRRARCAACRAMPSASRANWPRNPCSNCLMANGPEAKWDSWSRGSKPGQRDPAIARQLEAACRRADTGAQRGQ